MKNKITMEVPYFQTPNACFEQVLNSFELLVYIYLCRCGNHGAKAFPSYQTIAAKTGMSKSSVVRAIDSLIDKKLIKKKAREASNNNHLSNMYYVSLLSGRQHPIVTETPYKEQDIKSGYYRKGRYFYHNGKRIGKEEYQAACIQELHGVKAI